MAVTYDELMSLRPAPVVQSYTQRDAILYALGVGFGADPTDPDQLRFVYEEADFAVAPTFVTVLATPADWLRESSVDYARVVNGEQSIELHAPIPPAGQVRGELRISSVIDKGRGKGALIFVEREITDAASQTRLATVRQTIFARGDGGIGGPAVAQSPVHDVPARAPDGVVTLATAPQQALIYRLSGDYNPLHADPAAARQAGFPKPILHGLATFGVAAHAVLKGACGFDPARLTAFGGRFTAPVFPGETLATEYWVDGDVVGFRTRVAERNVVAISAGRAIRR